MAFTAHRRPRRWLAANTGDIVIAAVLALLPVLFFWRLIAPNPLDRLSIAAGDFTDQYYPLRSYAALSLTHGVWPLWNPSQYGGQPALADIQSGALYPPQIVEAVALRLLRLGFPLWALELQVIAHFSWAALGAYFLGKRLPMGRLGTGRDGPVARRTKRLTGVVVSLVFTYSGYMTGFPVQQLTILEVSAWLPWVLLAVDFLAQRLNRGGGRLAGPVTLAGATLAMALLPGHPQTFLYVVYLAVALFAWRVIPGPEGRSRLRAGIVLIAVFGVALGSDGGAMASHGRVYRPQLTS